MLAKLRGRHYTTDHSEYKGIQTNNYLHGPYYNFVQTHFNSPLVSFVYKIQ